MTKCYTIVLLIRLNATLVICLTKRESKNFLVWHLSSTNSAMPTFQNHLTALKKQTSEIHASSTFQARLVASAIKLAA